MHVANIKDHVWFYTDAHEAKILSHNKYHVSFKRQEKTHILFLLKSHLVVTWMCLISVTNTFVSYHDNTSVHIIDQTKSIEINLVMVWQNLSDAKTWFDKTIVIHHILNDMHSFIFKNVTKYFCLVKRTWFKEYRKNGMVYISGTFGTLLFYNNPNVNIHDIVKWLINSQKYWHISISSEYII